MIDKWTHIFLWIFFTAACIFTIIFILDRILFFYGWTLLLPFSAQRLLQFIVIALIFVITLLLRQIREELKKQSASS
jgi:hypothetical protein